MNDVARMRGGQRTEDVASQPNGERGGQRSGAGHTVGEAPGAQLHDGARKPIVLEHVADGDDVGVPQFCEELRLPQQPLAGRPVRGDVNNLHRALHAEAAVADAPDLGEAALSGGAQSLVTALTQTPAGPWPGRAATLATYPPVGAARLAQLRIPALLAARSRLMSAYPPPFHGVPPDAPPERIVGGGASVAARASVDTRCTPRELARRACEGYAGAMTASDLRTLALSLPGASESIACAGTPLESASFKINKKSFLFLGVRHVRLKVGPSLAAAAANPAAKVGAHGWVTLRTDALPGEIEAWVRESYRICA